MQICESLKDKIDEIDTKQSTLASYTENLSKKVEHLNINTHLSSGIPSLTANSRENPGPSAAAPREQHLDKDNLQASYRAVARKYNSVQLHPDLVFKFNKSGIKRNFQQSENIINSVAEYTETLLKITVSGDPEESTLEDITTVTVGLHHYLKAERTGLLVKSRYGDETG